MNRNSDGMGTGAAVLCTLGILLFIGWIIGLSEPKCARSGCSNETKPGSSYCWLHDNSYRSYGGGSYKGASFKSSSGSTGSSSSGGTNKSSGSTGKKSGTGSNSGKKYTTDSYDAGYDAVYDDGDYDYDRYDRDDDYARGVDDALDDWDEFGEDW